DRAASGAPGRVTARSLASGDGWTVDDMVCTSGPSDRPFAEQHDWFSIALVLSGAFQYRSASSRELMTPGSLLLGNAGQSFECGHDHTAGDRCLSFHYTPDYFARLALEACGRGDARLASLRLPPLKELSPLVGRACAALSSADAGSRDATWEEISVEVAAE